MRILRKKSNYITIIKQKTSKGPPKFTRIYFKKETENSYLEKIAQALSLVSSIATLFGAFFGGIIIFSYLRSIRHPNVLPETIGTPSALITILIVFGLLSFLIFSGFITPYVFIIAKPDISKDIWKRFANDKIFNNTFWISFSPHIAYLLTIGAWLLDLIGEKFIIYLLFSTALTPAIISLIILLFQEETLSFTKIKKYLPIILYTLLIFGPASFLTICTSLIVISWTSNELTQYAILISHTIIVLLNLLLVSHYLSSENTQRSKKAIVLSLLIPAYFLLVILVTLADNTPFLLLKPIRFIESPHDASWYLLHRNNSGISNEDLKKIKSNFICLPSEQQEAKNKPKHICTEEANQRHNALFGYMAWNLGSVKVFCPITVKNNVKTNEIGNTTNQCLTIDSKALQKMHGEHIGYSRTP